MALNFDFLGLGVNFASHDKGLQKEQGLVSRGFLSMRETLDGFASMNPFERVGEGLQQMADHVSGVISQVHGLTEGVNLTTGYEAHMQALGVEARRTGANMGYAGAQLAHFSSRAAGLADGLNTSATTAAEAIDAVARGGEGLRLVGLRTQADAVRFQASFGGLQELSAGIHQLRTEYELTDEQVRQVIGSTTAMGRATGNVSAAFSGLGDVLGALRQRAALQGSSLAPEELARSAAEVQGLAAGFYQMTHNADEARRMALDIFQSQLGAQQNWSNMFAGTENDVSDFVTNMSIAQGDVNRSFEQMREGPAQFTRGIVEMYRTAKRNGPVTAEQFNFLRGQLERALGPQSAQMMVNFMRTADDATLGTMATVQNATANLGQMAREAHRTGRTLQEEFQRTKDIGIAAFRAIGRHEAVALVRDTATEFRNFNSAMRDVVSRGGPMAEFVERLSAIHQIGALALIPDALRPMAVLFGHITEQMAPMITALGALGFRLSSLLNPYTLLIAVAGYLLLNFFDLYVHTRSLSVAFQKLGERIESFGETAWNTISHYTDRLLSFLDDWSKSANEWASNFEWGAFFVTWINRGLHALQHLSQMVSALGDVIFTELGHIFTGSRAETRLGRFAQNMVGVARSMLSGLAAALPKLDWGVIAHMALFGLFDAMLGPVLGTVVALMPWRRLGAAISKGMADAMKYIRGGGLEAWLTSSFEKAKKYISTVWPGLEAQIVAWAEGIPAKLTAAIHGGTAFAGEMLALIRDAIDHAKAWVLDHQDEIVDALSAVGSRVLLAIGWLVQTALGALWDYVTDLPELYGHVTNLLESALDAALVAVDTLMAGLLSSIETALVRAFPQYEETIHDVMGTLRALYHFVYDNIYRGVILEVFDQFRAHVRFVRDEFNLLGDAASSAAAFIRDPWESLKRWFLDTWNQINQESSDSLGSIEQKFNELRGTIEHGINAIEGFFSGAGETLKSSIGGGIDWITGKWDAFKARVMEGVEAVSGILRRIFGGGGEAEHAAQDATGMTAAVADQAHAALTSTSSAVSSSIVSGLVGAFRGGFASVIRGLVEFKDHFVDIFTRFGTTLRDKIVEAVNGARAAIDGFISSISNSLGQLTARLQSILSLATTLAAAAQASAPGEGNAQGIRGTVGTVRPLDHSGPATQEDVRQAIHDPQWYRQYIQVFDARMRELIEATQRAQRAQPSGTRRDANAGSSADTQRRVNEGVQAGV